jgi:hypothetical protein
METPVLLFRVFVLFGAFTGALLVQSAWSLRAQESDALRPTGHFQIENPASLGDADALAIYQRILSGMVEGYALSKLENAGGYARWRRYNKTPYRSAQHGERFVSNYANATAAAYGRYERAGALPVGSVIAKDSFTVTEKGDVFSGALFVMEKMDAGFNPESRDWRYSMIMPDGSLFGMTKGDGDDRVRFCITCHRAAGDAQDHLFFLPEAQRIDFGG